MPVNVSWLIPAAVSFGVATLSGLGVGSAGLFVLYLTALGGWGQVEAQALNLVFFLASAGAALLLHVRGRRIPWGIVLFLLTFAIPGALVGARLVRAVDAVTLRHLFGWMLVAAGGQSLWRTWQGRAGART